MGLNFDNNQDLERLFLLELLVDNVELKYSKVDMRRSFLSTLQKTLVRFYFQDYPPIEVTEDDFCPMTNRNENQQVPFKSGKACLFSLQDLPEEMECYEVGAEIFGQPNDQQRILLARACIDLGELFKNVVSDVQSSCHSGPATRAAKGVYPIVGENGVDVGTISLFIRVSCFGKRIVGKPINPCTDLGGNGDKSGVRGAYGGYGTPVTPAGDDNYPSSTQMGYAQYQIGQPGFQTTNVQGINTGINTGAIMSRPNLGFGMGVVSSGMNLGMQGQSPWSTGMMGGVPIPNMGGGMFGTGSGTPGMGGTRPNAGGAPIMQNMMPGTSLGLMPSTGGNLHGYNSDFPGQSTTMPEQPASGGIDKCPGDPDEDKDVLRLAIGNKNKVGKKPKLEIVLKTPKLKFDEVKTEERETQYLDSDITTPKPPPAKGGKKGKGKKGKK